ncbi:hypothetical protein YC2023_107606 [Brassica napus]
MRRRGELTNLGQEDNEEKAFPPPHTSQAPMKSDVNMIFKFSWIIAITAEIKMGRKLRKTTTDAVAEILVVPCSRGGLWRGEETRGMRREIESVV